MRTAKEQTVLFLRPPISPQLPKNKRVKSKSYEHLLLLHQALMDCEEVRRVTISFPDWLGYLMGVATEVTSFLFLSLALLCVLSHFRSFIDIFVFLFVLSLSLSLSLSLFCACSGSESKAAAACGRDQSRGHSQDVGAVISLSLASARTSTRRSKQDVTSVATPIRYPSQSGNDMVTRLTSSQSIKA